MGCQLNTILQHLLFKNRRSKGKERLLYLFLSKHKPGAFDSTFVCVTTPSNVGPNSSEEFSP